MNFFKKLAGGENKHESQARLSWIAAVALGVSALAGCKEKNVVQQITIAEGSLSENPELDAAIRDAKNKFGKFAFFPLIPRSSFNEQSPITSPTTFSEINSKQAKSEIFTSISVRGGDLKIAKDTISVEHVYALNAGDLRQVEHLLPKGWVTGEVAHVKQVEVSPEEYELLKKIGLHGWRLQATMILGTHEIVFAQNSNSTNVMQNLETFLHELGHANDFLSDNSLNSVQRINLLRDLGMRLSAPDRLRSSYVENISISNNAEENAFTKATEYFAELSVIYFTQPELLAAADFRIVDAVVKMSDPSYDPFVSSKKIRALFQEIQKRVHDALIEKISKKLKENY